MAMIYGQSPIEIAEQVKRMRDRGWVAFGPIISVKGSNKCKYAQRIGKTAQRNG